MNMADFTAKKEEQYSQNTPGNLNNKIYMYIMQFFTAQLYMVYYYCSTID